MPGVYTDISRQTYMLRRHISPIHSSLQTGRSDQQKWVEDQVIDGRKKEGKREREKERKKSRGRRKRHHLEGSSDEPEQMSVDLGRRQNLG